MRFINIIKYQTSKHLKLLYILYAIDSFDCTFGFQSLDLSLSSISTILYLLDLIVTQSILISSFYIRCPNIILKYITPYWIYHVYSWVQKIHHLLSPFFWIPMSLWLTEEWNNYVCLLYNLLLYSCHFK